MDEEVKSKLKKALTDDKTDVRIVFTKKDGTIREMRCTTCFNFIPPEKRPKEDQATSSSETTQRVFDLDKGEWRSFNYDSVTRVELKEYYVWSKPQT